MPIAHLEAFYPYFLGNISKLASPLKQWVRGHPEVRWSRFVSSKKPCFRHNFWTKTFISPIFTTYTPPLPYMVGKLRISASIWHQAIEIWSILQAVRILLTPPETYYGMILDCDLTGDVNIGKHHHHYHNYHYYHSIVITHGIRRRPIFVEIYQWWKGPSKF